MPAELGRSSGGEGYEEVARRMADMQSAESRWIMIMLGLSAGWTRTTSMVSPDWLMGPLARSVVECLGKAELRSV
jgi:hypothetical protein